MDALVSINGEVLTKEKALISVFDRGFLFGDGVYETGKSIDRCPLFLEEHLKRLVKSAGKLLIPVPWKPETLQKYLFDLMKAFGKDSAYFRMYVTRGCIESVGLDKFDTAQPNLVMFAQGLPETLDSSRKKGVSLLTSKIIRNSAKAQDPDIKTSNYLNSLLALQDVKSRGADDGILCDVDGNVTEGTTFSLFGITKENVLITPSLEVGILNSITRHHILDLAKKVMKVEEGTYKLETFRQCKEVFIASSVREIFPVNEWDGVKYTSGFQTTLSLHEKFQAEIKEYVKTSPKY